MRVDNTRVSASCSFGCATDSSTIGIARVTFAPCLKFAYGDPKKKKRSPFPYLSVEVAVRQGARRTRDDKSSRAQNRALPKQQNTAKPSWERRADSTVRKQDNWMFEKSTHHATRARRDHAYLSTSMSGMSI